jgi:hypothetical protein
VTKAPGVRPGPFGKLEKRVMSFRIDLMVARSKLEIYLMVSDVVAIHGMMILQAKKLSNVQFSL